MLECAGTDLMQVPLIERRHRLEDVPQRLEDVPQRPASVLAADPADVGPGSGE
jgi:ATP-dependent DNA ligase